MQLKKINILWYILPCYLLFLPNFAFANTVQSNDGTTLLSYKKRKTQKLCSKPFYLNDIDISLSSKGLLIVSLTQVSKISEGFTTHLAIEILDEKDRVLTVYKTENLELKDEKEEQLRSKNYYFTESFNYQFTPEEFKIFIENAKKIVVSYKDCGELNTQEDRESLSRKLPKEVITDNSTNLETTVSSGKENSATSYVVAAKALNLRNFARINGSAILYELKKGDVIDVIEKREGWWLVKFYSNEQKVQYIGFVHSDFLLPLIIK